MIKRSGDLFTTTAQALGHGVNVHGVMGAGIAKAFKDKFPENYRIYRQVCLLGGIEPGQSLMVKENNTYIFNMASQDAPGANASYQWLFDATSNAVQDAINADIFRIAIPQIGCGIGGLTWNNVEPLLRTIEILTPGFEWEVWKYV